MQLSSYLNALSRNTAILLHSRSEVHIVAWITDEASEYEVHKGHASSSSSSPLRVCNDIPNSTLG